MALTFERIPDIKKRFLQDFRRFESISTYLNLLMEVVHVSGGYIAGGLPRKVLQTYEGFFESGGVTIPNSVRFKDPIGEFTSYFKCKGDIDVFFPTLSAYTAASLTMEQLLKNSPQRYGIHQTVVDMSVLGNAKCFHTSLSGLCCIKTQFVSCEFLPQEEMLSQFDFMNSMVSFDGDDVIAVEGWRELEKTSTLHMLKADSKFSVSRVNKYVTHHKYKKISKQTSNIITDKLIELFVDFEKNGPLKFKLDSRRNNPDNVTRHIMNLVYGVKSLVESVTPILPFLQPEDLLVLYAVYNDPKSEQTKNHAEEEIQRRLKQMLSPESSRTANDPKWSSYYC